MLLNCVWCWRRLLRVPWRTRRSNESTLKEISPETPILWSLDVKNWLIGKVPDAGKDWRQKEKGTTEDKVVGWHHQLDEHEFEWALGDGNGQGGLVCCSPWGHKELDTTERLKWTETVRSLRRIYLILLSPESGTVSGTCWIHNYNVFWNMYFRY